MNLVGKIFIVLTFIMSISFMMMAMMVYATHKNWRLAIERTPAETGPGEQPGLKHQLEEERKRFNALQTEKQALDQEIAAERLEVRQVRAKLETERDRLQDEVKSLQKKTDALFAEHQKALAALDTSNSSLAKL